MGETLKDLAVYVESCRNKRNSRAYDRSGGVKDSEAVELSGKVAKFKE